MGGRAATQRRRFRRLRAFDASADPAAWAAGRLAGVDEAGVGPLAGPVVAAAVILPPHFDLPELYDSKRLSAAARRRCERVIRAEALALGLARVSSRCIDRINILRAMLRAQRRALQRLLIRPSLVLVDGKRLPPPPRGWQVELRAVVRGDSASLVVAAASVLAKCARDRAMLRLERTYPGYGFARHKGYGTEEHVQALRRLGPSPVHRALFCRFLAAEAEQARQMRFAWGDGLTTVAAPRALRERGE